MPRPLRAALPDLPDEPSDVQLTAWVELAELIADDGFRTRMAHAAVPPADEDALPGAPPETVAELIPFAKETVTTAKAADIDPDGDDAVPFVDAVVEHFAATLGRPDGPELREWMARQFDAGHDPLVERYWRLVWIVNDWQVVPARLPFQPWLIKALRRRDLRYGALSLTHEPGNDQRPSRL